MCKVPPGALALVLAALASLPVQAWEAGRLSTPLEINGHLVPYREFAVYLMPGSPLSVHLADVAARAEYRYGDSSGVLGEDLLSAASEPGLHLLEIRNLTNNEAARVSVFTLLPSSRVNDEGLLNGYRIGHYPPPPPRNLAMYKPPPGFIEVTEANADTLVSPNFTLRQFLSKQEARFPKYLVLRPELLLKLESVLAALNESGHETDGFVIMSGYRTPFYNQFLGNVTYSQHTWGGAADLFIDDSPRDGQMDDLNNDGTIDMADAQWLADFIDAMSRGGEFGRMTGGLGVYDRNTVHGPFVHVDVRGLKVRW